MHPGCKSIGHPMAKTHILPKYDSISNIFTPSSAFNLLNIKEICLQCIKKKHVTNIKYQDYVRFLTRLLFKLLYFSMNYKEKMYKQNKAHCISLVTGSPQRPNTRIHSRPTVPRPEQETAQGA